MKQYIFEINKIVKWTNIEDKVLLENVKYHNRTNWKRIAKLLKNKDILECKKRFKKINAEHKKGYWTENEDDLCLDLIDQHGKNWSKIAKIMKIRNSKQVRDRYINFLDPRLNRNKFSLNEDLKIFKLHEKLGNAWKNYMDEIPYRSADMIKNRFNSSIKNNIKILEIILSLE